MPRRALLLLAVLVAAAPGRAEEPILATTTSVRDTGLLDALLPRFERESGARVKALALGSGAALRMGADGEADVVLSHAPEAEEELVRAGKVLSREPLMENFFVIAGPPGDPARVREATSAAGGLRRIAETRSPYASRGDGSGTHLREQALLREAGLDPAGGWPGFVSTGSGMGQTLQVAGEKRAYALCDLGTFLAFRERVELAALSKREPALRNVYSVLVFRPAGRALAGFLLSQATAREIASFGRDRFGEPLFRSLRLAAEPGAK